MAVAERCERSNNRILDDAYIVPMLGCLSTAFYIDFVVFIFVHEKC